jgi:hypothetical protein
MIKHLGQLGMLARDWIWVNFRFLREICDWAANPKPFDRKNFLCSSWWWSDREKLWLEFFLDPSQWWDNRSER